MLLNLVHPVLNGAETLAISDVIGDDDAVSALVVAACNGLEAFLPGGIPDLQFDRLAVHFDSPDLEVDSNSGHEVICEHVVSESQEEGGLADAGVSDQQHLEQIVAINIVMVRPIIK